jgi:hypothetical protein
VCSEPEEDHPDHEAEKDQKDEPRTITHRINPRVRVRTLTDRPAFEASIGEDALPRLTRPCFAVLLLMDAGTPTVRTSVRPQHEARR